MALISVIIPVYKVEEFLDECVTSIVNQTYTNLEIILVDDGSPDNCPHLCDEWARKDERIKVVHKKNSGLSSARNAGLDIAKGDYICFVDSDDFYTKDAIEIMYNRIVKDDNVDIVSGKIYRYIDGVISTYNEKWNIEEERRISPEDFTVKTMEMSVSHTVVNKLYCKHVVKNVRFREGRNNEDTLFMYDLGKEVIKHKWTMVEISHYVYYYRYREDSICTSTKIPLFIDVIKNLHDMMNDSKESNKKIWETAYFQYSKNLFVFLDSLLLNDIWKPLYFKKYQAELRQIPFSYILNKYNFLDALYILLLQWAPCLRKCIRLFKRNIKNEDS